MTKCVSRALDLSPILALSAPYGDEWSAGEKRTGLADMNKAMIRVIVFVSYRQLLAYDVPGLAFPTALFKPAYFRDHKGGVAPNRSHYVGV